MVRLTEAQKRAYERSPQVGLVFDARERQYCSTTLPPAVRRDTIESLLAGPIQLARRGRARGHLGAVELTATGKQVREALGAQSRLAAPTARYPHRGNRACPGRTGRDRRAAGMGQRES